MAALVGVACATAVPAHASREDVNDAPGLDAYARGRLAEADGALGAAASAYREAVSLDPDNIEIIRRGYRQAVMAGDKVLALKAAHGLDKAGELPRDGVVLLLVEAIDKGRWTDAASLIDRLDSEQNLAFLVPFMRSWVSMRDGPYDPPVVPAAEPYALFAIRYLEEQLLLQRLVLGDAGGAAEAYAQTKERKTALGLEERWIVAARFERLGQHDLALELAADDGAGAGNADERLKRAIKLYRSRKLTPQTGLAKLMYRLGLDLLGQGEATATLSIMRMASFADPSDEDVRVGVARAALAAGYPDTGYAEAGLLEPSAPGWLAAQAVRLQALTDQAREEDAVALARQVAQTSGDSRADRLLGDMLARRGDFAAAAAAYRDAQKDMGDTPDASLLLQLGGALEQAGQWKAARPILEKVVVLAPDSAAALNHLGYALADRGEDLPEALALLEKANRLRPQEAAFIDSLGWAFYRSGQIDKALPMLQQAAVAEPANAEINEHLGDVLWASGRHFEARYVWRAALVGLDGASGDERLRVRITRKIEDGTIAPSQP